MAGLSFSGGDQLRARLKEMAKKLDKGGTVRAGFLEGAAYPDGTPVAYVAAIQEFGAPKASIPPRPFFRPTINSQSQEWGDVVAAQLCAQDYDAGVALRTVGEVMRGDIQEGIVAVNDPPLSPVTLMLRKMKSEDQSLVVSGATVGEAARRVAEGEPIGAVNTKPLQETGFMKSRVDYEVQQ